MLKAVLACIMAISCIYLYGLSIMFITNLIVNASYKKEKQRSSESIRLRAQQLLETDPQIKKIYISLRLMHLKNKQSLNAVLLEQKLRTLIREKAVRQEIIHMVRAKNSR